MWAWCWDAFGDHCEEDLKCATGVNAMCPENTNPPDKAAPSDGRRRRRAMQMREMVTDLSQLPEGALDVYVHRGRRGFVDWLKGIGASIPCLTTGDKTLEEWNWVFFEYSQSIPVSVAGLDHRDMGPPLVFHNLYFFP